MNKPIYGRVWPWNHRWLGLNKSDLWRLRWRDIARICTIGYAYRSKPRYK